jgi:hypothetical protein
MTSSAPDSIVKDEKSGGWIIRAERRHGNLRSKGEVVVASPAREPGREYARMAAARAWLDLAEQLLRAGDADGAISAARAGIGELGDAYRSPRVDDDTTLKLEVAEEQRQGGQLEMAARLFIKMLETRTNLFAESHPDMRVGR